MSDKRRTSRESEVPKSRRKVDASRRASSGTTRGKTNSSSTTRVKTSRATVKSTRSSAKVQSSSGVRSRSKARSTSAKISAKRGPKQSLSLLFGRGDDAETPKTTIRNRSTAGLRRTRFHVMVTLGLVCMVGLVGRSFWVQVAHGAGYREDILLK